MLTSAPTGATPANKAALERYFGKFLPARLDSCTTCHLPRKFTTLPASLAEFPHNSFGHRLALAADELRKAGKRTDIPTRLRLIAAEDSDGDGVDNLSELLLGHATVLHQMGLDSHRLEVPGRKRLAIDHGSPILDIIS
jgi:hypothetical protein